MPSSVVLCTARLILALSLLCCESFGRASKIKQSFVPQLCKSLLSNVNSCPSLSFMKEDLICFVTNNSLTAKASGMKRLKNRNISECQEWSQVTFTRVQEHICLEVIKCKEQPEVNNDYSRSEIPLVDKADLTLHQACRYGKLSVVRFILSRKLESINSLGKSGRTPVMTAAKYGHASVFQFLVSQGCDMTVVDDNRNNILHVACKSGITEIVSDLIRKHGFDVNSRGWHGRTPAMKAALAGNTGVLVLLVTQGCNVKARDRHNNSILHIACSGGKENTVKYIISKGIGDIESRGFAHRTPVLIAAMFGRKEVFRFLVTKGCNMRAVDENGNNLLHTACTGGHIHMVKYLMTLRAVKGMEKTRNKSGFTPLEAAMKNSHKQVVVVLRRG